MPYDATAVFSGIIVMAFDIVCGETELIAKPGNQLNERIVCRIGEFSCFIGMTAFNGDGGIVALGCSDCPGNLVQRHALDNGAVHINDKMRADISACLRFEIVPVLESRGFGIGNVMDNDFF